MHSPSTVDALDFEKLMQIRRGSPTADGLQFTSIEQRAFRMLGAQSAERKAPMPFGERVASRRSVHFNFSSSARLVTARQRISATESMIMPRRRNFLRYLRLRFSRLRSLPCGLDLRSVRASASETNVRCSCSWPRRILKRENIENETTIKVHPNERTIKSNKKRRGGTRGGMDKRPQ